ncbi:hypothetical protein HHI36_001795 [Cryptolaemus montrouzieri]|uniref:Uncharacterized protein n=1 Tax=Cryptolaemus montrouzieri TaxID=559131 RepID=A0ABD2P917_9CUCU
MFGKRNQLDVRKSTSKIQDPKKDLTTRIKHLKNILDNVDVSEAKGFLKQILVMFITYYMTVLYKQKVIYDNEIILEQVFLIILIL